METGRALGLGETERAWGWRMERQSLGLRDGDKQSLGFSPPPSLDESQARERLCLKNKYLAAEEWP